MNEFYTKLAGTTFNGRDEVIEELYLSGQLDVGQELILQRQPYNASDSNAIAVLHPSNNEQLGWISRQVAQTMAPKIDAGTTYRAFVSLVTGGNGYNYGINIKIQDKGETL